MNLGKINSLSFNLFLFSRYRSELMGFATILILICHASSNGIELSDIMRKVVSYGNLGVEMFFSYQELE
jgi:hypothetical protein